MKKKIVKPDRICFECLHYEACQSWNIGSLVKTAADNCVNYRPSVNVREVVRGEWKVGVIGWECSVCTCEANNTYPICPYCGAMMLKGEADGNS